MLSGCRFIPVLVQVHFCSQRSFKQAQIHAVVLCVRCVSWYSVSLCARLFYLLLDRNMETHHPRTRQPTKTGLVPAGQTLSDRHNTEAREVFSECVIECSCMQICPRPLWSAAKFQGQSHHGLCGGPRRVVRKWMPAESTMLVISE